MTRIKMSKTRFFAECQTTVDLVLDKGLNSPLQGSQPLQMAQGSDFQHSEQLDLLHYALSCPPVAQSSGAPGSTRILICAVGAMKCHSRKAQGKIGILVLSLPH